MTEQSPTHIVIGGGSQRQRRIGIVDLARRLVIDLCRFA